MTEKFEDNWEKVGEYFSVKYFVCNDPTSRKYRTLLRKLTDKEFKIYEPGEVIAEYLGVAGFGYEIYVDLKTGEDIRVNFLKM